MVRGIFNSIDRRSFNRLIIVREFFHTLVIGVLDDR